MTAFREDEFVRILDSAPSDYFPGKTGVIVSIATCASPITERATGTKMGDLVIWVGINLGETVEPVVIPERWLESIQPLNLNHVEYVHTFTNKKEEFFRQLFRMERQAKSSSQYTATSHSQPTYLARVWSLRLYTNWQLPPEGPTRTNFLLYFFSLALLCINFVWVVDANELTINRLRHRRVWARARAPRTMWIGANRDDEQLMGSDTNDPHLTSVTDSARLRAASYVRMSTEHQKYSIENQADSIMNYANSHNMEIVRQYSDSGKSGLRIDGRQGLKRLLLDVDLGDCDFEVILVYDVSRWGRFQDADESAHYEYICRKAGLQVHYCAEQFANDGSPVATIVKGVKRAMAGEYSRELSAKVFAGQSRLIEKGFRQGGAPGFGLRRMLLGENGEKKSILKPGQQKSLQTDRVILVPGPEDEVRIVNQIYQSFVERGLMESQIATELNERGLYRGPQQPWTRGTIHEILTNEKYIGNNVFNKTSFKLKQRRV